MAAQFTHARKTLETLKNGEHPIIEVAKKCDLIQGDKELPKGVLGISAKKSTGIDLLAHKVQDMLIEKSK